MAKKRANGEGNIRKRKDGRWEGRYTAGYDEKTGKRLIKNVLGKTQAEVKEKLAKGGVGTGVCGPRVRTVTACQGSEILSLIHI